MDPLRRLKRVFELASVPMGENCKEQENTALQQGLVGIVVKGGKVVIGARQDLSRADVDALVAAARALGEMLVVFHERFAWEIGATGLVGRVAEHFTGIEVEREQVLEHAAVILCPGDGIVLIEWSQLYFDDIKPAPRGLMSPLLAVQPLRFAA